MAKSQPLYTVEDQFSLLDNDLPSAYTAINLLKYRLLMSCSNGGTLDQAKNRFLFLIQDTELKTLFSSILEIPEERSLVGVANVGTIHSIFSPNYNLFENALDNIRVLGTPSYTIDLFYNYFYGNEDPIYKLSVIASVVMFGYLKEDEINNRKE